MSTPDTQMNQYLTTIAEAVHGRDMRAAIHDGMEKTYNDSYAWFNQSLGNANQALQKATEALEIAEPMGDDIQEIKDLAEDLDTKYDETNERVNNIIAHNQDTQGNSELIDLRTTYDGQIKTSAGTAVRSQISNLHSRINNLVREQSTGELEDCHAKPVYVPLYENQYPSSAFAAQTLQLSLPGSPVPSLAKYAFIKITFKDSNLFGAGVRSVYIPNPGKDAEATNIYTSDGHVTMPADGTYGLNSYSRKFTAALSSNDTVLNIMFTDCEKIATDNPFAIDNSDMTISDPSSTTTTDNEYLIPYEVFLIDYVLDGEIEIDKDTELIDIRNGEDGTTYQSAGAAVRGQVVSAKNKTASTQSMIAPLYSVSGTYAAGDYVNYGDKLYKAKQAISSEAWTASHWDEVNVMDEVDSDVGELKSALNAIYLPLNFEIGINRYVENGELKKGILDTRASVAPMIPPNNEMIYIQPTKGYSINIMKRISGIWNSTGASSSYFSVDVSDAELISIQIISSRTIPIDAIPCKIETNLPKEINELKSYRYETLNVEIGVNRYLNNNTLITDQNPIRASVAPFKPKFNKFVIAPKDNYRFGVFYSSDSVSWNTFGSSYIKKEFVLNEGDYICVQIIPLNESTIPQDAEPIEMYYTNLVDELAGIKNTVDELSGSTVYSAHYYGEKFPFKKNGINYRQVIQLDGYSYPLVENGIAVYGDYLVSGVNADTLKIYNLSSGTKLSTLTIPNGSHFNCLSFSSVKYDSNDILPLLYAETEGLNGLYNVIRISDINTATVIKKYRFNEDIFGISPQIGWDFERNLAYSIGRVSSINNNFKFIRLDLSNETENDDGTYTPSIISEGKCIGLGVRQDSQYFAGRLYMMIANQTAPYKPHIVALDCDSVDAVVTSIMPEMPFDGEGEGLSIYEDSNNIAHLYVSEVMGQVYELYD